MAYQALGLGSSANDGTGDDLRTGGDKINDNFVELYTKVDAGASVDQILEQKRQEEINSQMDADNNEADEDEDNQSEYDSDGNSAHI